MEIEGQRGAGKVWQAVTYNLHSGCLAIFGVVLLGIHGGYQQGQYLIHAVLGIM
jgi:hypothetical protein